MAEDKNIVQNYQAHDLKIILNNNEIAPSGYNLLDFEMKFKENTHTIVDIEMEIKEEYLKNRMDVFNSSKIFLDKSSKWDETNLRNRQNIMVNMLINNKYSE